MDPSSFDCWDKDYLKTLVDTYQVPILSMTASEKWISKEIVDEIVDIATYIKCQIITFSPPRITDKKPEWFTRYLSKAAKMNHIVIAAKNVEPKMLFFIIPEYKSSSLGDIRKATGDTALNIWNIDRGAGMDLLKAYQMLWSSLRLIYLSDKKGSKQGLLPWKAGWGVSYLPLESFLMKLKASSYKGYITVDVNPKELEVGSNKKVLENLLFIKDYYRKHFLDYKA